MLKVSVVIPCYGRPELLAKALQCLSSQTLARETYEVIVVDDGGEPAAEPTVLTHGGELQVRTLRKEKCWSGVRTQRRSRSGQG